MKQIFLIIAALIAVTAQASDADKVLYYDKFGDFTDNQLSMLNEDGFFVLAKQHRQMYHIYEVNQYYRLPSFITVDSALQWWYWTYKAALEVMELEILIPKIKQNIQAFADVIPTINIEQMSPVVKDDFYHMAAYWKVAASLQDISMKVPQESQKLAEEELALIKAHAGIARSPIFEYDIDYSHFIVRGHYADRPELTTYFLAVTWFTNGGFTLYTKDEIKKENITSIRRAAILIYLLNQAKTGDKKTSEAFIELDKILNDMIGISWGYKLKDFVHEFKKELNDKNFFHAIEDDNLIRHFISQWQRPFTPFMQSHVLGAPQEPLFRLMNYRYQIDMFQLEKLVKWPERPLPSGMDIPAIFGNELAYDYLVNIMKVPEKWPEYPKKMKEAQSVIRSPSTIVELWLTCLNTYLNSAPDKAPAFMQREKWKYKTLESYLASWSELRHALVLYTLEVMAECDYDLEKVPVGYVEPRPDVYQALQELTKKLMLIFSMKSVELKDSDEIMIDLMTQADNMFKFLEKISYKELMNENLTREEIDRIYRFGAEMETFYIESLLVYVSSIRPTNEARDMALIIDVARGGDMVLEVGVGLPHELYAIIPTEKGETLTRGAVFSYYEFEQPYSNRLTDAQWKQMLKQGTNPSQPAFTTKYRSFEEHKLPKTKEVQLDCWSDFPYDEVK